MELSDLILKAGYTPKKLAEELGVTKFAIYAYTSGRAFPGAEKLCRMSNILGISEKKILQTIAEARNEKRRKTTN
jgi:transcriptional regulator with XRE-family HTH domain